MSSALSLRYAAILTVPPLMWAANAVVGRLAVGMIQPLTLNLLRWVVALLVLLPLARGLKGQWPAVRARWHHLAILGLLGMGCYNSLQYLALHTTSPLNVTLIASSLPVWMLGLGMALHGVRPRRQDVLGALLSLAGVLVVLTKGRWSALTNIEWVLGDALMLVAIITWAFYSWMLAKPPASMQGSSRPPWNWAEFLFVQTAFGLVWCSLAAGIEIGMGPQELSLDGPLLALVLFVGVAPSVLAYWCWGLGVAKVGPALAGFFVNLTPLFAALLSAAMLGEWPKPYHAVAFASIVAGIVASSRGRKG